MTTVAPPCRNRLAMALPAPFVPPVTRTRLPANSLSRFAFVLDAVMAFSSISGPCLRLLMGRVSGNNAIARDAPGQMLRLRGHVLHRAPVLTERHGAQTASDTRRPLFP